MPQTAWSAPPLGSLNQANASPAIAAALTDLSPVEVVVLPGQLLAGTRIRLFAQGEYTTTSATPNCVLGFYMAAAGTAISGTIITLTASSALTAGATATSAPWQLFYWGRVVAVSGPNSVATASFYGQGQAWWSTVAGGGGGTAAGLNGFTTVSGTPATAALRTVAQATTAGNTLTAQEIMVGSTWSTVTAVTSMTCDEFTCELIG
jgi:hypothetical protein